MQARKPVQRADRRPSRAALPSLQDEALAACPASAHSLSRLAALSGHLDASGPGVDAHPVQRIQRHSDLRTTTDVYAHLLVEDLRSAINSIAPKALPPEVPEAESKKLR